MACELIVSMDCGKSHLRAKGITFSKMLRYFLKSIAHKIGKKESPNTHSYVPIPCL